MQKKVICFRERRDRVCGCGELTWDDGHASKRAEVEVCDLSDNGVQVRASIPIPVGMPAYLTGEEFRCIGTVRYCNRFEQGYRVGLQFNSEPNRKNAIAG